MTTTKETAPLMPTLRLLPDLEDALRQIPGVRAVSVVTDGKATPLEVHVLAAPGKAAKQVVRDVQSVALARYDIDVDHRIVSVVQIGDDEPLRDEVSAATAAHPLAARTAAATANGDDNARRPADAPDVDAQPVQREEPGADDAGARTEIRSLSVRTTGAEAEAMVSLRFGEHVFEGRATASAATTYRHRLVALAMLTALEPLLGLPTEVESATVVEAGIHTVALCVLVVNVPRLGPQSISGSAVVRGDEADAVARSVLDALNRRISG